MRNSIRTTNILEPAFKEIRRRTRPMNLFPNADSANRIFYGVTKNPNQSWNQTRLKNLDNQVDITAEYTRLKLAQIEKFIKSACK